MRVHCVWLRVLPLCSCKKIRSSRRSVSASNGSLEQSPFQKDIYFAVTRWEGEILPQEAESVVWILLNAVETLDLGVDKIAVREYRRVYPL